MKSGAVICSLSAVASAFSVRTTLPQHHLTFSVLSAVPPSSAWGSTSSTRGVPSKTARESACTVEWEPMTELERRIEDGVNYNHIPNSKKKQKKNRHAYQRVAPDVPSARGVFCGYRVTDEEYYRLKSANPKLE